MIRLGLLLVLIAFTALRLTAQQTTPAFEVVSVKPNTSTDDSFKIPPTPPEGVALYNRSLASVVRYAYQLPPFRVVGMPRWTEDERFDIVGKAAKPVTEIERQSMVRALLADRFRLKAHFEKREQAVYVMTRARSDGSVGPGLRPRADCVDKPCQPAGSVSRVAGVIRMKGTTMAELAEAAMESVLGQVVRDESGIRGVFDVQASWRPDGVDATLDPADKRPSFFTAIQEQLGLRLEPGRAAVEVLVINSVERPTPN